MTAEPEFKHCSNCRWYMLDVALDPCSECNPLTNCLWEPIQEDFKHTMLNREITHEEAHNQMEQGG